MRACRSPRLFAAYRVLLRLLMPRHSPCALISLNALLQNYVLILKDSFSLGELKLFYPFFKVFLYFAYFGYLNFLFVVSLFSFQRSASFTLPLKSGKLYLVEIIGIEPLTS